MLLPVLPIWKQAPFIRLLIPLILGIILQWYFPLPVKYICIIACIALIFFLLAQCLRGYLLFLHKWIYGITLMMMILLFGVAITHFKNITHQQYWFGHLYNDSIVVVAVLAEPLIEKNKSYKADATVYALIHNGSVVQTKGGIIIYFKKDSSLLSKLNYGSTLVFKKGLQAVRNSGNPGAFDYKRYSLFHGITHQVYLTENEFAVSKLQTRSAYTNGLQQSRKGLLEILKKYIPGKREAGVAEALLIGYRDDLERDLVQAYANTGVIHVIAISGMHLAMIYGLLIVLLKPLQRNAKTKWVRGLIILSVLWLFTLLSGAGPSILRSAVMFSFIVAGESMRRKISVYHTLSASAFFLLCWNPFFLWDVGFQLSYAAVLSIVVFLRSVTHWFYCKHAIVNYMWKLIAVTLAAQILTTPLSIYHFHQVPNLFLISNLVIVPLSGFILYGEILLCLLSLFPAVALPAGKILSAMLRLMNDCITFIDDIPFAVSDNISISMLQTGLLYVFIITLAVWLMKQKKQMLPYALMALLAFMLYRVADIGIRQKQSKIIVYNIPRYSAVDFISGSGYHFAGDEALAADPFLYNFHLRPSRLMYRAKPAVSLSGFRPVSPFFYFNKKRILLLDTLPALAQPVEPVDVDVIILSKNINVRIARLQRLFRCRQYVFDASSPAWKIRQWKNDCDSLHLRRHSVQEDGAFILDL
ncbi:ComEC/Rec2 family competence protein [Agriterribacter sp.]|uniref:ComEC/Rec2 family competence protein n=1 Tax=Agriterribacter sp. TaxID=2821509 RepID=UPI002C16279E|nr:ComEC/Rec2 family competence protein [Agriterribacter sp.]HTN08021.1 ComEC/Rec2 family competence protein [Agriterribacter sp.]